MTFPPLPPTPPAPQLPPEVQHANRMRAEAERRRSLMTNIRAKQAAQGITPEEPVEIDPVSLEPQVDFQPPEEELDRHSFFGRLQSFQDLIGTTVLTALPFPMRGTPEWQQKRAVIEKDYLESMGEPTNPWQAFRRQVMIDTEAYRQTDMPTKAFDIIPGPGINLPGDATLNEINIGVKGAVETIGDPLNFIPYGAVAKYGVKGTALGLKKAGMAPIVEIGETSVRAAKEAMNSGKQLLPQRWRKNLEPDYVEDADGAFILPHQSWLQYQTDAKALTGEAATSQPYRFFRAEPASTKDTAKAFTDLGKNPDVQGFGSGVFLTSNLNFATVWKGPNKKDWIKGHPKRSYGPGDVDEYRIKVGEDGLTLSEKAAADAHVYEDVMSLQDELLNLADIKPLQYKKLEAVHNRLRNNGYVDIDFQSFMDPKFLRAPRSRKNMGGFLGRQYDDTKLPTELVEPSVGDWMGYIRKQLAEHDQGPKGSMVGRTSDVLNKELARTDGGEIAIKMFDGRSRISWEAYPDVAPGTKPLSFPHIAESEIFILPGHESILRQIKAPPGVRGESGQHIRGQSSTTIMRQLNETLEKQPFRHIARYVEAQNVNGKTTFTGKMLGPLMFTLGMVNPKWRMTVFQAGDPVQKLIKNVLFAHQSLAVAAPNMIEYGQITLGAFKSPINAIKAGKFGSPRLRPEMRERSETGGIPSWLELTEIVEDAPKALFSIPAKMKGLAGGAVDGIFDLDDLGSATNIVNIDGSLWVPTGKYKDNPALRSMYALASAAFEADKDLGGTLRKSGLQHSHTYDKIPKSLRPTLKNLRDDHGERVWTDADIDDFIKQAEQEPPIVRHGQYMGPDLEGKMPASTNMLPHQLLQLPKSILNWRMSLDKAHPDYISEVFLEQAFAFKHIQDWFEDGAKMFWEHGVDVKDIYKDSGSDFLKYIHRPATGKDGLPLPRPLRTSGSVQPIDKARTNLEDLFLEASQDGVVYEPNFYAAARDFQEAMYQKIRDKEMSDALESHAYMVRKEHLPVFKMAVDVAKEELAKVQKAEGFIKQLKLGKIKGISRSRDEMLAALGYRLGFTYNGDYTSAKQLVERRANEIKKLRLESKRLEQEAVAVDRTITKLLKKGKKGEETSLQQMVRRLIPHGVLSEEDKLRLSAPLEERLKIAIDEIDGSSIKNHITAKAQERGTINWIANVSGGLFGPSRGAFTDTQMTAIRKMLLAADEAGVKTNTEIPNDPAATGRLKQLEEDFGYEITSSDTGTVHLERAAEDFIVRKNISERFRSTFPEFSEELDRLRGLEAGAVKYQGVRTERTVGVPVTGKRVKAAKGLIQFDPQAKPSVIDEVLGNVQQTPQSGVMRFRIVLDPKSGRKIQPLIFYVTRANADELAKGDLVKTGKKWHVWRHIPTQDRRFKTGDAEETFLTTGLISSQFAGNPLNNGKAGTSIAKAKRVIERQITEILKKYPKTVAREGEAYYIKRRKMVRFEGRDIPASEAFQKNANKIRTALKKDVKKHKENTKKLRQVLSKVNGRKPTGAESNFLKARFPYLQKQLVAALGIDATGVRMQRIKELQDTLKKEIVTAKKILKEREKINKSERRKYAGSLHIKAGALNPVTGKHALELLTGKALKDYKGDTLIIKETSQRNLPFLRGMFFLEKDVKTIENALTLPELRTDLGAMQHVFLRVAPKIGDLARVLKAGFDFGAPFLQGIPLLARKPDVWAKATIRHYKVYARGGQVHTRYLQENMEVLREMVEMGIPFSGAASDYYVAIQKKGVLPQLGQAFEERILKGDTAAPARMLRKGGRTFADIGARFENAFEAFGDYGRIEMYKALRNTATKSGPDGLNQLAAFIRNSTGALNTGALGASPSQQAFERGWLFFSPRYTRASLALVADAFQGGFRGQQARQTFAQMLTGGAVIYMGVATALDQPIKLDPRPKSDGGDGAEFMTVNIAGQNIGIGSFWTSFVRLTASMGTTAANDPALFASPSTKDNPIMKWMRSRSAPMTGFTSDAINGANFLGEPLEDPVDWTLHIGRQTLPFAIENAVFEEGSIFGRLGVGVPAEVSGMRTFPVDKYAQRDHEREVGARERFEKGWDELNVLQKKALENDPNRPLGQLTRQIREEAEKVRFTDPRTAEGMIDEWFHSKNEIELEWRAAVKNSVKLFHKGEIDAVVFKERYLEPANGDRRRRIGDLNDDESYEEVQRYFAEQAGKDGPIPVEDFIFNEYMQTIVLNPEYEDPIIGFDYRAKEADEQIFTDKYGHEQLAYVKARFRAAREAYDFAFPSLIDELYYGREKFSWYWDQVEREVLELQKNPDQVLELYEVWLKLTPTDKEAMKKDSRELKEFLSTMSKTRQLLREQNADLDIFMYRWGFTGTLRHKDNQWTDENGGALRFYRTHLPTAFPYAVQK